MCREFERYRTAHFLRDLLRVYTTSNGLGHTIYCEITQCDFRQWASSTIVKVYMIWWSRRTNKTRTNTTRMHVRTYYRIEYVCLRDNIVTFCTRWHIGHVISVSLKIPRRMSLFTREVVSSRPVAQSAPHIIRTSAWLEESNPKKN